MDIDRTNVKKGLIRQMALNESSKGFQPEATLGCFYSLNVDNDSICKECVSYRTCFTYLQHFRTLNKVDGSSNFTNR